MSRLEPATVMLLIVTGMPEVWRGWQACFEMEEPWTLCADALSNESIHLLAQSGLLF